MTEPLHAMKPTIRKAERHASEAGRVSAEWHGPVEFRWHTRPNEYLRAPLEPNGRLLFGLSKLAQVSNSHTSARPSLWAKPTSFSLPPATQQTRALIAECNEDLLGEQP